MESLETTSVLSLVHSSGDTLNEEEKTGHERNKFCCMSAKPTVSTTW
jgi:hypothetical protein